MEDYDGGDRHRLKEPVDLRELRDKGCLEFEFQNSMNLEEQATDVMTETMDSKKDFFKNISLKNIEILSCSAKNAMRDFEELESTMELLQEGIRKKITRPGRNGFKAAPGSKVWIHYSAFLDLGDEPFDSSTDNARPFQFKLGHGNVLPGLDIAVSSMEVKEMADFLIQPHLAYGVLGCLPRIPPNAQVLFTIELLEFQEVSKFARIFEMSMEERNELPFDEVFKAADELKTDGKGEFKVGRYTEAVIMYSKAAKLLEHHLITTEEEENRKNVTLGTIFINLALCYLKLDKPNKTIKCCETALALPIELENGKLYYLMSKAYFNMGNVEKAETAIDKSLQYCPNHVDSMNLRAQIMEKQHNEDLEQKKLFKKMMALNLRE